MTCNNALSVRESVCNTGTNLIPTTVKGHQEVSRCRTRGESETHHIHMTKHTSERSTLALKSGQTSPEVQNNGTSSPTKGLMSSQKFTTLTNKECVGDISLFLHCKNKPYRFTSRAMYHRASLILRRYWCEAGLGCHIRWQDAISICDILLRSRQRHNK